MRWTACPRHRLLAPGSAALAVAADHLANNVEFATFLCPNGGRRLARVTVLSCARQPGAASGRRAVVSPPRNLHGLTTRDLEILGLLVEDWSLRRIGAALDLPLPTVADRVEHILTKLTAPSRTVAILQALRRGLYIPRVLGAHHRQQRH